MKSKNKDLEIYRNDVTAHLVRISGDIEHIKESQVREERHLEKLNGRVRKTENSISWIKGIGSAVTFVVSAVLSIIFFFVKE